MKDFLRVRFHHPIRYFQPRPLSRCFPFHPNFLSVQFALAFRVPQYDRFDLDFLEALLDQSDLFLQLTQDNLGFPAHLEDRFCQFYQFGPIKFIMEKVERNFNFFNLDRKALNQTLTFDPFAPLSPQGPHMSAPWGPGFPVGPGRPGAPFFPGSPQLP